MNQYNSLMAAIAILKAARADVGCPTHNPAWDMLYRAGNHLHRQADAAMRGPQS